MAVVLPNLQDAPSFDGMAVRDAVDFFAVRCMNSDGTCVISGCAVTQHTGSDMAINVASGVVAVAGTQYTVTGVTNVAIGAASSSDRRDTVVYTVGTGVQVIAGGPCGYTSGNWSHVVTSNNPPVKQYIVGSNAVPANSVILAEVYVATTTTAIITATNCVDKRLVSPGADVIGGVLQGSTNTESIIRANTLNQMGAPTAGVNMNNENFINVLSPVTSSQIPTAASLGLSQYAYVVSGCVWTADSPGSTLFASMTSGVVMIKGIMLTVAAVTSQLFTGSDDTYIDITDSGSGTGTVSYGAVAGNATAAALAGSSPYDTCRVAVILAGSSSIAAIGINQGSPLGATPGTTVAGTTVAAGSNGANITASTLHVAANTMAAAGLAIVDTSVGAGGNFGTLISYTSGGGTTTLSGVSVLSGSGTVATSGVVTQVVNNNVADNAGNIVYPTTPRPGLICYRQRINSFTTTSTSLIPVNSLTNQFVVPPGPERLVKLWLNLTYLASTAATGTIISGQVSVDGTGVGAATEKVAAVEGTSMFVIGITQLAPGTHVGGGAVIQGATGTLTVGVTADYCTMGIELI